MYTPFAQAFAYAIKQTPYAFVAKIILCISGVANSIIGGGGGHIFIYSSSQTMKTIDF